MNSAKNNFHFTESYKWQVYQQEKNKRIYRIFIGNKYHRNFNKTILTNKDNKKYNKHQSHNIINNSIIHKTSQENSTQRHHHRTEQQFSSVVITSSILIQWLMQCETESVTLRMVLESTLSITFYKWKPLSENRGNNIFRCQE